jgi:arginine deiminase
MRVQLRYAYSWKAAVLCLLFCLAALAPAQAFQKAAARVGAVAEWDKAQVILMHEPGDEVFLGVIHPAAALYEQPFSLSLAQQQHRNYAQLMQAQGVTVHRVVDVLLDGTLDDKDRAVPGRPLDDLRALAADSLRYDASALPPHLRSKQEQIKRETLQALGPHELVRILILRPTVRLKATGTNTGYSATYVEEPVMNLYFCRDQMITTAKGVVISRLNSPQRAPETRIMKFVLAKLGITPIYEVSGQGRLEGGDFFSVGEYAFIGQGLRTNAEGVRQLLEHQVFGTPKVAVVKDQWKDQEEMHLDTYFNIIGPKLATLVDLRMDLPGRPMQKGMAALVDVYELRKGRYVKTVSDREFRAFLEKDLGFTVIPVTRKDQNLYGINYLTLWSGRIMAIDGASEAYKKTLAELGVEATWMDFRALTSGYGAAHCTTQVLLRHNASQDPMPK